MHNISMTGAEALAAALEGAGVKRVYGVVGTSVVPFINALFSHKEAIRYVSCRHEQVSASMADTEGRLTGRPGISVSHSGPGTLNTAISLAIAWKDCSPVVAVSGAVPKGLRGQGGFLEVEHSRVFAPICKKTLRVDEAGEIPVLFVEAWRQAVTHPRGPVLLEVPEDLWHQKIDVKSEGFDFSVKGPPPVEHESVRKTWELLKGSERPVVLAGGGVVWSGGSPDLMELAGALALPVVTTGNGRGSVPEDSPLCYGRAGFGGGNPVADYALARADLILALGSTLSDMTTYGRTWDVPGRLILVNADRGTLDADRRHQVALRVHADAREFIRAMVNSHPDSFVKKDRWIDLDEKRQEWRNLLASAADPGRNPVSPSFVMKTLNEVLGTDAIVTTGQGVHLQYANDYLTCRGPGTYLSSNNFGAMGFGFPSALAAKLLHPDRRVCAILGDGEFMMTLQDMETMVRENLGVKILVINDNAYRVLWLTQRVALGGDTYGTEHGNPDMMALASAFGVPGHRIAEASDAGHVLDKAFSGEGPALIEVVTDREDMAPANIEAIIRMRNLEGRT